MTAEIQTGGTIPLFRAPFPHIALTNAAADPNEWKYLFQVSGTPFRIIFSIVSGLTSAIALAKWALFIRRTGAQLSVPQLCLASTFVIALFRTIYHALDPIVRLSASIYTSFLILTSASEPRTSVWRWRVGCSCHSHVSVQLTTVSSSCPVLAAASSSQSRESPQLRRSLAPSPGHHRICALCIRGYRRYAKRRGKYFSSCSCCRWCFVCHRIDWYDLSFSKLNSQRHPHSPFSIHSRHSRIPVLWIKSDDIHQENGQGSQHST
jgi:hypothetical protein